MHHVVLRAALLVPLAVACSNPDPVRPPDASPVGVDGASDGAVDANDVFVPPTGPCMTVGSWCISVPYPAVGRTGLQSLLAIAPNDVWMANRARTLVHYDGTGYQMEPPATALRYHRVTVGLDGTVWGTGVDGAIVRRVAGQWVAMPGVSGIEPVMAASSPTDAWAISFSSPVITTSVVQRFDGSTWTDAAPLPASTPNMLYWAIGASSTSNVWLAGQDRTVNLLRVWQWNGTAWIDRSPPSADQIYLESSRVLARGVNDVWVVGYGTHFAVHWDGTAWSTSAPPVPIVTDAWLDATGDLWVVGGKVAARLHLGVWSEVYRTPTFANLDTISGTSSSDVWIAGTDGSKSELVHFDGTQWTSRITSPVADTTGTPITEFATGVAVGDSVWLAPVFGAVRVQHGAFTYTDLAGTDQVYIGNAMLARSSSDVWLVGQDLAGYAVNHFNGTTWIPEYVGSVALSSLAESNGTLYAVGFDLQSSGFGVWTRAPSGTWGPMQLGIVGRPQFAGGSITDLWGDDSGLLMASNGGVGTWNGTVWDNSVPTPAGGLVDFDGPDRAHLWAVGAGGVYRYQAGSFTLEMPAAANEQLSSVVVVGEDAWALGTLTDFPDGTGRTVVVHRAASGAVDREVLPANGSRMFVVGNTLWLVGGFLATRPLP